MNRELKHCHDCGVTPGEPHKPGCAIERCSVCGDRKMVCPCRNHDPAFARWTGIFPGLAEAEYLGIDMNTLADRELEKVFFVKPAIDEDEDLT